MATPSGEDSPLAPPQSAVGSGPEPDGALAEDVVAVVDVVICSCAGTAVVVVEDDGAVLVVAVDVDVLLVLIAARVPPGDSSAQPCALASGPIAAACASTAPTGSIASARIHALAIRVLIRRPPFGFV
jgi:hypothetical protein